MNTLNSLRKQIDQIDDAIAELLDKRIQIAREIGKIKKERHHPICDLKREDIVLKKVKEKAKHFALKDNIENIYRSIMGITKNAQAFNKYLSFPFLRFGIIGLGLMGGSIIKALKAKNENIKIFTLKHQDNKRAIEAKIIDQEYQSLLELMQNSDIIVLASPISTIIPLSKKIAELSHHLSHKLLIVDIASVKNTIVELFEKITTESIEFISTHPIAGSEKRGFDNSKTTMFANCSWIIILHSKTSKKAKKLIQDVILFLGAKPIYMDTISHDNKIALISHIPGLISSALLNFVKQTDSKSLEIAGPGFYSTTRLAHDNSVLRSEIIKYNKCIIQKYLSQFIKQININEVYHE